MPAASLIRSTTTTRLRVLAARHAARVPPAAVIVLVLVLAWLAARLVWVLVPTPAAARWTAAPAPPQTHLVQTAVNLNTDQALADLFGRYSVAAGGAGPNSATVHALATAPETHLNLKLLGILANRLYPGQSRALIAPGGEADKPYALGQAITSGVLLKAIFPDRVVLLRNGSLETLRLHLNQGDDNTPESNVPIAVAGEAGNSAVKLSSIRTKLLANPSIAGQFIRVQPVAGNAGQGQEGYRIFPGPNRSAFAASGLHPGDIVTAVNGVPLNNPAQTLQLLSELSRAQSVTLTIKRGGQTQTKTLNFAR
ncbi:MAG TPA: type II secretion system protein GspC [Nevskiaceae bacterium]|nr:type II secretion system protein GspC [Nevskiaceae bacterium]